MPLHPARQEELRQLIMFRDRINGDPKSGFRLSISQPSGIVDYSELIVEFSGLTTLVVAGTAFRKNSNPIRAKFVIPPGHPAVTRVVVSFLPEAVPFHPHVWTNGNICWGNVAQANSGSWTLVAWTIAVLEYLQMNQSSFIGINQNSPANGYAMTWYVSNRSRIAKEIPQIDMNAVRQKSYQ